MNLDRLRLDGRIAVVTGATRGIGLGIARALAEAGAHVVMSSRIPRREVIEGLRSEGLSVEYEQADMEDPEAPNRLIQACLERSGRIDILINSAGIADNCDTQHFSDERRRRLMTINLDAVFRCCRAALDPMRKQGRGSIVTIGSMSGYVSNYPQPQAAYSLRRPTMLLRRLFTCCPGASQAITRWKASG